MQSPEKIKMIKQKEEFVKNEEKQNRVEISVEFVSPKHSQKKTNTRMKSD